jgi:hypothetical protein
MASRIAVAGPRVLMFSIDCQISSVSSTNGRSGTHRPALFTRMSSLPYV